MRTKTPPADLSIDIAPWRLSGAVYGTLLNHRPALDAVRDVVSQPPYRAAPSAPVLYIKPRNTLARGLAVVVIPEGSGELEVGASLGIVIGRPACRVAPHAAADYIAGYVAVNDVCIPHNDYYRPSIGLRARDGFCPLGTVVARSPSINTDALHARVCIDGAVVADFSTAELIRDTGQLLADVSEFMTLSAGDILTLGVLSPAPRARAGQTVSIEFDGLPALINRFEAAAP